MSLYHYVANEDDLLIRGRPGCCSSLPPLEPGGSPDVELARLAKALGPPARAKIARFLLERDECLVGALVDELSLAQSAVSQHWKVLREAGLIYGRVEGSRICYCVDASRLERAQSLLAGLVPAVRERTEREEECESR